jgi:hypothetical protein
MEHPISRTNIVRCDDKIKPNFQGIPPRQHGAQVLQELKTQRGRHAR